MKELDCDYLSTGHYAKVVQSTTGKPVIETSTDDWKDQTYFLFTLNPEVIPKLLFPVGGMNKSEVRKIAEEKNLVVARKKDSTGICFIGPDGYSKFIEDQVEKDQLKPGLLKRYPSGEVMAKHTGIHNFTYGQRKGLGISSDRPLYVVKIDGDTNDVWLGEEKDLYGQQATVKDLHWIDSCEDGEVLKVKIRFAHKGSLAKVSKTSEGEVTLDFLEPQRSITPGQAAVMYRDNRLVGGGWIQ